MTTEELRAPTEWDQMEGLDWKWSNIRMGELVWSDLPEGAEEAIEEFIRVKRCNGRAIERVHRLDPQTIEIVWYDDIETNESGETDFSEVPDRYIRNVRKVVQSMFGEHWRVERKPDKRRWNNANPQRAIVRRADHQHFRYTDESVDEATLIREGRPDGVPDWADHYGSLDQYKGDPDLRVGDSRDVYLYESGTGTIHLLKGLKDSLVVEDLECECGLRVQTEEIIDGGSIQHYAEYLREDADLWDRKDVMNGEEDGDPDPKSVLGDDLCTRCWKSYATPEKTLDGRVRGYSPPRDDYEELLTEGQE